MKEVIDAVNELTGAVADLDLDPKNTRGYTVGDELYEISYTLARIAEALEKVVTRMPIQE